MLTFGRTLLVICFAGLLSGCAEAEGGVRADDAPSPSAVSSASSAEGLEPTTHPGAVGPASAPAPIMEAPVAAKDEPPPRDTTAPACPAGMAMIERFCIDRYEAHLVARRQGGERTPHPHFQRPEEGVSYEAKSEPGVFPQAYISRIESQSACANVNKRLCSRREWQRACQGGTGALATMYPYGQRSQPGRCNVEKPHLLTLRFGADPWRWAYAQFNDPTLDQEPGFLARSGEYDGCVGDAKVYDLVGNLHEWVSDTADAAFRAKIDAEGVYRSFQYWSPGNGVFMGGFYSTHGELGPGCSFTTVAHEPGYHDYSTGFRCCADAQ